MNEQLKARIDNLSKAIDEMWRRNIQLVTDNARLRAKLDNAQIMAEADAAMNALREAAEAGEVTA